MTPRAPAISSMDGTVWPFDQTRAQNCPENITPPRPPDTFIDMFARYQRFQVKRQSMSCALPSS
ncbi:hypothetical protein ATI61_102588 [Archangium gephyra]|uniref:Uncharacterized protein n=1 Tax=Archangium gephyra TaxID=48 RepID=A0ABX9K9P5_9BACT|nr:hypothetical protein ATI61_102588 [Archangium gephyra]